MLSSFFTPCLLSFPHSFRRCYLNFVPLILRQGWGFPLASILYGEWCGLVGLAPFCLVRLGLWAFQGLSFIAFHWFLSSWSIGHFFFLPFSLSPFKACSYFLKRVISPWLSLPHCPWANVFYSLFFIGFFFFSLWAPICVMLIHFLGLRGMTPLFYFYSLISPSFFLVWFGLLVIGPLCPYYQKWVSPILNLFTYKILYSSIYRKNDVPKF